MASYARLQVFNGCKFAGQGTGVGDCSGPRYLRGSEIPVDLIDRGGDGCDSYLLYLPLFLLRVAVRRP